MGKSRFDVIAGHLMALNAELADAGLGRYPYNASELHAMWVNKEQRERREREGLAEIREREEKRAAVKAAGGVWEERKRVEWNGKWPAIFMKEDFGTGRSEFGDEHGLSFVAKPLGDGTLEFSERRGPGSRSPEVMMRVVASFRPEIKYVVTIGDESRVVFSFDAAGPSRSFKEMLR